VVRTHIMHEPIEAMNCPILATVLHFNLQVQGNSPFAVRAKNLPRLETIGTGVVVMADCHERTVYAVAFKSKTRVARTVLWVFCC